MMQVGFVVIVAFHVLLFARYLMKPSGLDRIVRRLSGESSRRPS